MDIKDCATDFAIITVIRQKMQILLPVGSIIPTNGVPSAVFQTGSYRYFLGRAGRLYKAVDYIIEDLRQII